MKPSPLIGVPSSEVPSSDKDLILAVKAHTTAVSQAAVMVEDYK